MFRRPPLLRDPDVLDRDAAALSVGEDAAPDFFAA